MPMVRRRFVRSSWMEALGVPSVFPAGRPIGRMKKAILNIIAKAVVEDLEGLILIVNKPPAVSHSEKKV